MDQHMGMKKLQRVVFGGGGPRVNRERYERIQMVERNLQMWRDFDNPHYLERAITLLEEAR